MEQYPYIKYPKLVDKYLELKTPCLENLPIPSRPILEQNIQSKNYLFSIIHSFTKRKYNQQIKENNKKKKLNMKEK